MAFSKQFLKSLKLFHTYKNSLSTYRGLSYNFFFRGVIKCTQINPTTLFIPCTFRRHYATDHHQPIYSKTTRGSYSKIEQSDIDFFVGVLGKSRVITGAEDDLDGYNVDWLKSVKGKKIGHGS